MSKAAKDIYETFKTKGVQGAAELAQALFSPSNSYVPYGRGQSAEKDHDHQQTQGGQEQAQQERGGRDM